MADINNIQNLQDLKDVIAEYLKSPRNPPLKGAELNIILSKVLEFAGTPNEPMLVENEILHSVIWDEEMKNKHGDYARFYFEQEVEPNKWSVQNCSVTVYTDENDLPTIYEIQLDELKTKIFIV